MNSHEIHSKLDEFRAACEAHRAATISGDADSANEAADEMTRSARMLASDTKAVEAFRELIDSDSALIAVSAACYLINVYPTKALSKLRRTRWRPDMLGLEARHALRAWKKGQYDLLQD